MRIFLNYVFFCDNIAFAFEIDFEIRNVHALPYQ